jgi:hypothetical protein
MDPKPTLGRLERVAPRTYWEDEARDFTPWLATPENIAVLSDAIGLDLEVQDQEVRVGPFRADILCLDTDSGDAVLVENQLAPTDHTHLGQLFTYAAGLDAVTIVWIADRFREEHRAAVDWLNRITHEDFRFFGIEVELWRIGASALAPKFNVVAKPNDWSKTVRDAAASRTAVTETGELQVAYWAALGDFLDGADTRFAARTPKPRHSMDFALGRTGAHLVAYVSMHDHLRVAVALYLKGEDSEALFDHFHDRRAEVEAALGFSVEWEEKPDRKHSQVIVRRSADTPDSETWPDLHRWTLDKLEAFGRVFGPPLRALPRPFVPEGDG